MATDIEELLNTIKDGVYKLAKESFTEYIKEVENDGETTLQALKEDIQTWADQVKNGDLNLDDLEFLIKGKKDVIKITALTQKGAAKIQLDKFKQGVIDLIFSSIKSLIK